MGNLNSKNKNKDVLVKGFLKPVYQLHKLLEQKYLLPFYLDSTTKTAQEMDCLVF